MKLDGIVLVEVKSAKKKKKNTQRLSRNRGPVTWNSPPTLLWAVFVQQLCRNFVHIESPSGEKDTINV